MMKSEFSFNPVPESCFYVACPVNFLEWHFTLEHPESLSNYFSWISGVTAKKDFHTLIYDAQPSFRLCSTSEVDCIVSELKGRVSEVELISLQMAKTVIRVQCDSYSGSSICEGFWGALSFASFIASKFDGIIYDVDFARVFRFSEQLLNSCDDFCVPSTSAFVRVIAQEQESDYTLLTDGCSRFGLPEVQMSGVSEVQLRLAAEVLRAFAQELLVKAEIALIKNTEPLLLDLPDRVSYAFFSANFANTGTKNQCVPVTSVVSKTPYSMAINLLPDEGSTSWSQWFDAYGEIVRVFSQGVFIEVEKGVNSLCAELKAKESLPSIIQRILDGSLAQCNIFFKCPFQEVETTEHMWLLVKDLEEDKFIGELQNSPVFTNELRRGEVLQVSTQIVSDWAIEYPNGLVEGYFSK